MHLKAGVEILSKSIPAFLEDLSFSAGSHCFHDRAFTAKVAEKWKRPRKRYRSAPETEKKNLEKFYTRSIILQPL